MPLFFIFIIIPLVELMILLEVGSVIGSGWTFLIIIATAIVGTKLVKQQGVHTWSKIQSELNLGALPAQAMVDGVCILVSGVLLITPGFMTDILGLLLLTPPFRSSVYKQVGSKIQVRSAGFGQNQGSPFGGDFKGGFHQNDSYQQGNTYDQEDVDTSTSKQDDDTKPKVLEGDYIRKD